MLSLIFTYCIFSWSAFFIPCCLCFLYTFLYFIFWCNSGVLSFIYSHFTWFLLSSWCTFSSLFLIISLLVLYHFGLASFFSCITSKHSSSNHLFIFHMFSLHNVSFCSIFPSFEQIVFELLFCIVLSFNFLLLFRYH